MFVALAFHLDEGLRSKMNQHLVVLGEATNAFAMWCSTDASSFILFPIVIHSFDLMVIAIGITSIKGTHDPNSKSVFEDRMVILQKGYSITLLLVVLAFGGVSFMNL
jgi:hypothetical protein